MVICVEVKFLGVFRQISGKNHTFVKLERPVSVRKAIENLTKAFSSEFVQALIDPDLEDPRPNSLILINGKEISALQGLETLVKDSDEIVLVPVSHGG